MNLTASHIILGKEEKNDGEPRSEVYLHIKDFVLNIELLFYYF
jgi:hypothetical protein